jgi:hypothetical protein
MSIIAVASTPLLDHADRCDRCGSRAYVYTVLTFGAGKEPGELLFCRHHWLKHREAASPYVSVIVDESRQLFEHVKDDGGTR